MYTVRSALRLTVLFGKRIGQGDNLGRIETLADIAVVVPFFEQLSIEVLVDAVLRLDDKLRAEKIFEETFEIDGRDGSHEAVNETFVGQSGLDVIDDHVQLMRQNTNKDHIARASQLGVVIETFDSARFKEIFTPNKMELDDHREWIGKSDQNLPIFSGCLVDI